VLLSADPGRREEQLEWLWLRIGNRELVLLPTPAPPGLRSALAKPGAGATG
jgi:hypothetical protein